MKEKDKKRRTLLQKAVDRFRFPQPVALLLSTVIEPRTDGESYSDALTTKLQQARDEIGKELYDLVDNASLSETGRVEKICLVWLGELRAQALKDGAGDVAERLFRARAISRGEVLFSDDEEEEIIQQYIRIPDPQYLREGRPPTGRWR